MEQLMTAAVALIVTALSCKLLLPWMRRRGWLARGVEPNTPKAPSMGGVALGFGVLCALLIGSALTAALSGKALDGYALTRVFAGFGLAAGFGLMGLVEDYLRVVKKQPRGFAPFQRFLLQLFVAVAYLFALHATGVLSAFIEVPFVGAVDFGWMTYPLLLVVILGTVNAVRLSGEVEGLSASVHFVAALGFCLFAAVLSLRDQGLLAAALAGGSMGVLCFNFAPARLLLGQSGTLFFGGMAVAMAFACDLPLFLLPVLIVYGDGSPYFRWRLQLPNLYKGFFR